MAGGESTPLVADGKPRDRTRCILCTCLATIGTAGLIATIVICGVMPKASVVIEKQQAPPRPPAPPLRPLQPPPSSPTLVLAVELDPLPQCTQLTGGPFRATAGRAAYTCDTRPAEDNLCEYPRLEPAHAGRNGDQKLPELVVWRSRYWYNFGEFMHRVMDVSPSLAQRSNVTFFLAPPANATHANPKAAAAVAAWPPPHISSVLSAFGDVHFDSSAILNRTFETAWLCCLNDIDHKRAGREALATRTLAHLHVDIGDSLDAESATLTADPPVRNVRIINRTDTRLISNLDELLAACARRADLSCSPVTFDSMSFSDSVRLMNTATDALIGMHGAGLVNAFFLRSGAHVVEIYGQNFGRAPSFGLYHFAALNETGLHHQRMWVPESEPSCVAAAETRCPMPFDSSSYEDCRLEHMLPLLIDCPVTVDWASLERLFR